MPPLLPTLLLLASLAQAQAPPPPEGSPTAVAPKTDEEGVLSDPRAAARAEARRRAQLQAEQDRAGQDRANEKKARDRRLLLGLVALLLLWLLTRRLTTVPAAPERPRRRIALNHAELGHLVFEIAQSHDLHGFRDLFLSGTEAAALLGEDEARTYLEQRSDALLRRALGRLSDACATGTVFVGVEPTPEGGLGIKIRGPSGGEQVVPVGTVTEVGAGLRLHLPEGEAPAR